MNMSRANKFGFARVETSVDKDGERMIIRQVEGRPTLDNTQPGQHSTKSGRNHARTGMTNADKGVLSVFGAVLLVAPADVNLAEIMDHVGHCSSQYALD